MATLEKKYLHAIHIVFWWLQSTIFHCCWQIKFTHYDIPQFIWYLKLIADRASDRIWTAIFSLDKNQVELTNRDKKKQDCLIFKKFVSTRMECMHSCRNMMQVYSSRQHTVFIPVRVDLSYVSSHFMMHFCHKILELAFYYYIVACIVCCNLSRLDTIVECIHSNRELSFP